MERLLANAFIVTFIGITLYHFSGSQKENFPFSSFRMYRNLMSTEGLVEYRLVQSSQPKIDRFLSVGDFRYFMKSRLDPMIREGRIESETAFAEELQNLFLDPRVQRLNIADRLFLVRIWDQFEAKSYNNPSRVYEFPLREFK